MEACISVEREQDKIIKKLKTLSGSTAKKLQQLIDQVAELKAKFEDGLFIILIKAHHHGGFVLLVAVQNDPQQVLCGEQVQWIKDLHKSSKEACHSISAEHKDIHASISKYGRAIDKVYLDSIIIRVWGSHGHPRGSPMSNTSHEGT